MYEAKKYNSDLNYNSSNNRVNSKTVLNICIKCYQVIRRDIKHSCRSTSWGDNLNKIVDQLPQKELVEQIASKIISKKIESDFDHDEKDSLSTKGRKKIVSEKG